MKAETVAEKLTAIGVTDNVNIADDGLTVLARGENLTFDTAQVAELCKLLKGNQLMLTRSGNKVRMAIYQ